MGDMESPPRSASGVVPMAPLIFGSSSAAAVASVFTTPPLIMEFLPSTDAGTSSTLVVSASLTRVLSPLPRGVA